MYTRQNNPAQVALYPQNGRISELRRDTRAPVHAYSWQEVAIAAYQQSQEHAGFALPAELATRLRALTGRVVAPETIYVDRDAGLATTVVDGVVFRLRREQLSLLRPCVQCGIGHFESPALASRADLGYALNAWQPLCAHCPAEEDSVNWLDADL
jgi:hypothetical protein